jgi:hypothetical protein
MNDDVFSIFTPTTCATSMSTSLCFPSRPICNNSQAVDTFFGNDNDTATMAAITTIGTPTRDVLFTTEANATITTVTGNEMNCMTIYKHGWNTDSHKKRTPELFECPFSLFQSWQFA